jgi:hypothetical protein
MGMDRKSILFISSLTNRSGSAVRIRNIAKVFCDLGYQVTLSERITEKESFAYKGLQYTGAREIPVLPVSLLYSFLVYLKILMKGRYDFIFCLKPLPNAILPVILLGKGALKILDIDDMDYAYYRNPFIRRMLLWFTKYVLNKFHIITYHNDKIKCHLNFANGYKLDQGVALEDFTLAKRTEARKSLNLTNKNMLIVYIGSLGFTSGLDDLLLPLSEAIKNNNAIKILIIGEGSRVKMYLRRVSDLSVADAFIFKGYIANEQIPFYLSAADIGLNYLPPNSANPYRASLKVREYLAAGLRVISNLEGDSYIFKDYISVFKEPGELTGILAHLNAIEKKDGREFLRQSFEWNTIVTSFNNFLSSKI